MKRSGIAMRGMALAIALVAGMSAAAATDASSEPDRLERALADYAAAQSETDREARVAGFARAAQGFAALVEERGPTAPLLTNLGNAALQAGQTGQAVLAYRRALLLDPENVTADQNLAHVRARLPAWVPRPTEADALDRLRIDRRIPLRTRRLAGAACFALAAGALVVAGRRQSGAWRGVAFAFGLAWVVLLVSSSSLGGGDGGAPAVVVADEAVARSSDSALSPLALPDPLPQGVEVELLEAREDFARVRLANGRDVWLRRSVVAAVVD